MLPVVKNEDTNQTEDTCQTCGSTELFDTDVEPGHEGTFVTVCLTCGTVQGHPKTTTPKETR